ncbi:hypothetical protein ABT324_11570 [Saccharopolyspora sp. NPDC000359]|uniref:hypothetical protein n=1 Tax=Saccharopolyspora sp. NPDC000359 TaxID=3154251 RepID=UPI00332AC8E9
MGSPDGPATTDQRLYKILQDVHSEVAFFTKELENFTVLRCSLRVHNARADLLELLDAMRAWAARNMEALERRLS